MPRFVQQVEMLVGEGDGSPVRARRGSDPTPGVLMIGLLLAVGLGVSTGLDGWAGITASGFVLLIVVFVAMVTLRDQVALVPRCDDVAVVGLSSLGGLGARRGGGSRGAGRPGPTGPLGTRHVGRQCQPRLPRRAAGDLP